MVRNAIQVFDEFLECRLKGGLHLMPIAFDETKHFSTLHKLDNINKALGLSTQVTYSDRASFFPVSSEAFVFAYTYLQNSLTKLEAGSKVTILAKFRLLNGFTLGARFGGKGSLLSRKLFVIPNFQEAINTYLLLIAFAANLHSY